MNMDNHKIDPRAGIFLLLIYNFIAFKYSSIEVIGILVAFSSCIMFYFRLTKAALKFILFYFILFILLRYILPNSPKIAAMSFAIIVNYALKILPCLMIGTIMIKTVTMNEMIAALRKLHCPEQLIVSLSITLRYFPALKEEIHYINDAMKLKNMNIVQKIRSIIIPLMISATNTVEELSKAAVARGIDNPVKKTSIIDLKLKKIDYVISMISVFLFIYLVILGGIVNA